MSTQLRRESLRRQLDLMTQVRDQMRHEPSDDYDRWSAALMPLTDAIMHELMALEGVPPYPHPAGTWEKLLAHTPDAGERERVEP